MLMVFSFTAKPGKEREFEALLNNPEAARNVATAMGATRNALFLKDGRMIRVFEFPEGRYNPRRRYSALDYRSPLISSGPRSKTIAQ